MEKSKEAIIQVSRFLSSALCRPTGVLQSLRVFTLQEEMYDQYYLIFLELLSVFQFAILSIISHNHKSWSNSLCKG